MRQIDELLAAALDRPAEERLSYIRTACLSDTTLAEEVAALLSLEPPGFLEAGALQHALPVVAELEERAGPRVGQRLGVYRLLQQIGRGGMSVVYLAERDDQSFQKRVALKLLHPVLADARFLGRFRREREILARLDHPSIARILDGGETDERLPYLVMELVEGTPVDVSCDRRRMTITERLAVFLKIGEAVAYAHQNLIVHRDLKPTNVLVTEAGDVKLLDFGIARILSDEAMLGTATVDRVMTPAYASPEQIRGEPVRTVSDVFSLGVLLYELLTGRRPHRGGLPHELARAILDEEPPRPSAAAVLGPAQAAAARAADPKRLGRRLRGDLDSIVLKALRKDPARRYPSVDALLEDIRRHLAGRPVSAREGAWTYRAGKFARRRWKGLAAAAGFALLGLAAGVNAWRQHLVSERQRVRAEQVSSFLVELFQASDPFHFDEPVPERRESITARELLERGERRIRGGLEQQPEVQAALMNTIGVVYADLGSYERAKALLQEGLERRRRLLGPVHADVAESLVELARACSSSGDHARATSLADEALAIYRRLRTAPSPILVRAHVLASTGPLHQGDHQRAEARLRAALAVSRQINSYSGPNWTNVQAAAALSRLLRFRGAYDEAEALLREALATLGTARDDAEAAGAVVLMRNLSRVLTRGERVSREAEELLRECVAVQRRLFAEGNATFANDLHDLGVMAARRGALDEAEPLMLEAVAMLRKAPDRSDDGLAPKLLGLARMRYWKGDLPTAERLYRETLGLARGDTPVQASFRAQVLVDLGSLLTDRGRLAEAERLIREGIAIHARRPGPAGRNLAEAENVLGAWLAAAGRYAEAEALLARTTAALRAAFGDEHSITRRARARLEQLARLRAAPGAPAAGGRRR